MQDISSIERDNKEPVFIPENTGSLLGKLGIEKYNVFIDVLMYYIWNSRMW